MEAKTHRIVIGAAAVGLGVVVARSLAPKLHRRCRAGCGCVPAQMSEEHAASSTSEIAHV